MANLKAINHLITLSTKPYSENLEKRSVLASKAMVV